MKFINMSYKDFVSYCEVSATDGLWSPGEAAACLAIIERIQKIEVRKFGILMRKKTEEAREAEWRRMIG